MPRGQAEAPPLDDLDVIVGEANGAEGQGGTHYQPDEGIGEVAPQQRGQKDGDTDQYPAHGGGAGLFLVVLRTVFTDVLADLEFAQLIDDEGPNEEGDEHCSETGKSGPERQIPEDAEGSEVGEKLLIKEPVKQTSSATRTRIPVAILQSVIGYVCIAFRREPQRQLV